MADKETITSAHFFHEGSYMLHVDRRLTIVMTISNERYYFTLEELFAMCKERADKQKEEESK